MGIEERISAMQAPMMSAADDQYNFQYDMTFTLLNMLMTIHPTVMTPGPPVFRPYAKRLEED